MQYYYLDRLLLLIIDRQCANIYIYNIFVSTPCLQCYLFYVTLLGKSARRTIYEFQNKSDFAFYYIIFPYCVQPVLMSISTL